MRTGIRGTTVLVMAAVAVVATATPAVAGPADATVVRVDAGTTLAPIRPAAIGVNTPIWNPFLLDQPVPGLIRKAGIGLLEFNGGGLSDLYHWQDGSATPDPDHPTFNNLPPRFTFDQFENVARQTGAQTLVHVNYGTGTAAEAAGWVGYARQKHYGVRDWVIGEEVWGNGGIPGIAFEPDQHQDKSPQAYAHNSLDFIAAMKAADPGIRVGVELSGVAGGPLRDWDAAVLAIVGRSVDFVDFHDYPFSATDTSDAGLLKLPRDAAAHVGALRGLVDQYAGPGHHVDLVAGEANSAVFQAPQQISMFNALYLADDVLSLLESGTRNVAWWALHNGGYGSTGGDLGLLSSGDCNDAGTVCPPAVDTPFPPYYGMRLVGAMARTGGALVPVSTGDPLVVGHAVREPDGSLAVLVLNENPTASVRVRLDLCGARVGGRETVLTYGSGDSAVHVSHDGGPARRVRTLAPYSLTLVLLPR
jgi:alpha-L-arabinofuranosidase